MAPLKIKHVVSFTSQDPKNCVENLCVVGGDSRSWLCNPQDRSGVLRAELQLERASYFGYIDVGNFGSAFIQIDVGRSSWPLDQPYITLLPTATLMSPAESRQGTGLTGVRMFKKGDFLSEGAEDSWDRVRVTCTQPFNKRSQFGLSFLRIRSPLEESEEGSTQTCKENQGQVIEIIWNDPMVIDLDCYEMNTTPDKSASGVREWLSSPAVQRTFFGGMKGEGVVLSRTARMVLTASQAARRSLPLPSTSLSPSHTSFSGTQNTATSSTPTAKPDATTHIPNQGKPGAHTATPNKGKPVGNMGNIHPHTASMACLSTVCSSKENTSQRHLKRKPNSKSRQNQLNGTTSSKHGKPAVSKRPIATLQHTATAPYPHPSPEPQDTGDLETTCPICGVFFTAEYLPLHAASCQQVETRKLPGGIVTPVPRPFPVSPASLEESMVPCPLCSFRFPLSHIQMHASTCGDPVDPHVIWVD